MPDALTALNAKQDEIISRLAVVETLLRTEAERCPLREIVPQVAQNTTAIGELDSCMRKIQLKIASWAGFAGVAGGVIAELGRRIII